MDRAAVDELDEGRATDLGRDSGLDIKETLGGGHEPSVAQDRGYRLIQLCSLGGGFTRLGIGRASWIGNRIAAA